MVVTTMKAKKPRLMIKEPDDDEEVEGEGEGEGRD
jgi:hypothetical protein